MTDTATDPNTEPLRGNELLRAVVNKIIKTPTCWNQASWHCGTSHCVGGWAQIMGGKPEKEYTCASDAMGLLGLSKADAEWLFSGNRTLPEIRGFAAAMLKGEDYFASDGFDRDGFDRDGFDRAGFNRAGFDRDGFNRAGFDRAGFNRDGFDRAGFNRAGRGLPLLAGDGGDL